MPEKTNEPQVETLEVDRSTLTPLIKPGLAGHRWIQRGPYLICTSCPLEHGVHIGNDVHFIGYDEQGLPKIVKG